MLHPFYAQLCPACAALNYEKRTQLAPLQGRVILVTGARVKVGFQARSTYYGSTYFGSTYFGEVYQERS